MKGVQKGKATPEQIARNGHIAAAIRHYLTTKHLQPQDLNEAIGMKRSASNVYVWMSGKIAPGTTYQAKLAKVMGLPAGALAPREPGVTPPAVTITLPGTKPRDILTVAFSSDGTAHVKLDAILPIAQAMPLVRSLLDFGLTPNTTQTP